MWYIHESTHQNEINIIYFTKVLFNYVVDKKTIIKKDYQVYIKKDAQSVCSPGVNLIW